VSSSLPAELSALSREEKLALLARMAQERSRAKTAESEDVPRIYPLAFAQQRFWFLDQLDPGSYVDNIFRALRLTGDLNRAALERAVEALVRRHAALRTHFPLEAGEPRQVVEPALPGEGPVLALIDLIGLTEGEVEPRAIALAGEEARQPFDLARGPLFRAKLLRLGPQSHTLLLCVHHIIADGWSLGLLLRELAVLYGAFAGGEPSPLSAPRASFGDFARWQRERLQGEALAQELGFWRERLEGASAVLELPTDHPRRHMASPRGNIVSFEVPNPTAALFKALAQTAGATSFMALLALFDTLLFRCTNQGDFVVGVPVANRHRTEHESVVGCFSSTLLVRAAVKREMSFREVLAEVRGEALAVFAHSDLPFEKLVEELQPHRNLSHNPLFQVMFALQNAAGGALSMPGLTLSSLPVDRGLAKLDLTLDLVEVPGGITGYFEYSTDLFEEPTIARMAGHFQALLKAALAEPDRAVGELPILSAEERRQILVDWNQPAVNLPPPILDRLAEQARRTPDAPAVLFGDARLTFAELHRQANRLARFLRRLGVGPEMSVGVCVERSLEMPLVLLAVLKAGGAWVPLDPEYPKERLALMIEDTAMPALITQEHLADRLPAAHGDGNGGGPALLCVDRLDLSAEDPSEPDWPIPPESLAYIVYTSGSTGRPKGVAVPHRALANHATSCAMRYRLGPDDRVLQFTSISFDITSEEIFPTWLMGGAVVPRPPGLFPSFDELAGLIERYGITAVDLPTAYWHEWVGEMYRAKTPPPPSLRLVVIGTEQALPERMAEWLELVGDRVRLNNSYASTEATVTAVVYEPDAADLARFRAGDRVPVGKTIPNCCAYVLDASFEPVPVGVPGYVYMAGPNVSRGYLNWPDRTAASFLPDPFAEAMGYGTGQRMYRQGDIGRWLPTGDLEYLGRADDQVKIRGFRVEPDEVGTVLARHPAVKDCVVLVKSDGPMGKRLVGYLTLVPGRDATVRELRDFLRETLPDHMVPAALVLLDTLPLTSNGRVDQRALPEPSYDRPESEGGYVAPKTAAEEILEGIWCEVLGLSRVGSGDDFFDLGGHSLLGTQVVSRAREQFRMELPLRALFENPTLSGLARRIEDLRRAGPAAGSPRIEPIPRGDRLPLSFAQQRLWFLDQLEPGTATYNIPQALHLQYELHVPALAEALSEVAGRHEALRTTFSAVDGRPYQVVHPPLPAFLPVVDLGGLDAGTRSAEARLQIAQEARRPFSLEQGPLLRTLLLRLASDEHVLLATMHHIVSDGWSLPVFVGETASLYTEKTGGKPAALPELAIQYADFAHWQRQWLQGATLEAELAQWRERLRGLPPVLELPTDRPRPAVRSWRGAAHRVPLAPDLFQALKLAGRRQGATPFMVVLTGLAALLHRYSGQESFAVGVPVAGRNRVEIEPLIGFFINTLVLRCDVGQDTEVRALVEQIRERVLDADAHQDVPFEKLVEELAPERSLSHSPLFQVMLAFQNIPRQNFAAGEGLRATSIGVTSGTVKFDLKLAVQADDDQAALYVEYATEIFDAATIARLAQHLARLLEGVAGTPQRRIAELPLLGSSEVQQLREWNDTAVSVPRGLCLHELIEAQAECVPDQPAVTFEERTLTYRELDTAANRLAHRLRALGVGPEVRVGLAVERGAEMIVGLLAALKAGGAYVPLDPTLPRERLAWMIEDAGIAVLLTQERLLDLAPKEGLPVICLDGQGVAGDVAGDVAGNFAAENESAPVTSVLPESPAYVIYTSGSTGRPKGVVVEHRQLVNYVLGVIERLDLASCRSFALVSTFAADLGNTVLFPALVTGGTLHVLSEERATNPRAFAQYLDRHGVDCLKIVPSHLAALMAVDNPAQALPRRRLVLGGEAASWELVEQIRNLVPGCEVFNHYGPTETTVGVLTCPLNARSGERSGVRPGVPPLGGPLPGSRVHLLDARLQPVPPGVSGEVYIGGAGIARGYLGRPDLTADRFVPDPFAGAPGERLYRTGDLARRMADGKLVFGGRIDHQVKIRGFRIELGEIEATLSHHPAVQATVVVLREDRPGNPQIVAYYVPAAGQSVTVADLRADLRRKHPDPMIPSWFVALPALPLTANGKVDRKALPAPEGRPDLGREHVEPTGEVQERVAAIWSEVLRLDRIGATDNFFELGGHSLLATQVISRVQKAFGLELALRTLFDHPTVAGLAEAIIQHELGSADAELLAQLLSELENAPA